MKKINQYLYLVVVFVILSFNSFAEKIVDAKNVELRDDNIVYDLETKKPFTGLVKDYLKNGELKAEINYRNGLLDGIFKAYYNDEEKLLMIATFKEGKINGSLKFYTDEYLREEYVCDTKTLHQIAYSLNDTEFQNDITFIGNYADSFIFKYYYPNGKIKVIENYKDNLLNGESKYYYENGKISAEGNFINGLEEGEYKVYYENGQLRILENYSKGELNGPLFNYYENGDIKLKGQYVNGKLDGEIIGYDEDGNIFLKGVYENGILKNGDEINIVDLTLNENGNLASENEYGNLIDEEKERKENISFMIIVVLGLCVVVSGFFVIHKQLPNFKNLTDKDYKKIFDILMKYDSNNEALHSSFTFNGFGSRFFNVATIYVDGYSIDIKAKTLSILFLPTPIILGYLICNDKEILATIQNEGLKKAKEEILEYLQKI